MKACSEAASRAIRVLSPRIEPPDRADDDDHDVLAALFFQRRLQFGNGGEVGGRERGDAENMHIVLDRLARGFLGGRKQRADIDVKADIGKG